MTEGNGVLSIGGPVYGGPEMAQRSTSCWARFLQLQAQFHALRVDFIAAGLNMGLTYTRLATTSIENDDGQRACKRAATAQGLYERLSKLLEQVPLGTDRQNAHSAPEQLQEALVRGISSYSYNK